MYVCFCRFLEALNARGHKKLKGALIPGAAGNAPSLATANALSTTL